MKKKMYKVLHEGRVIELGLEKKVEVGWMNNEGGEVHSGWRS